MNNFNDPEFRKQFNLIAKQSDLLIGIGNLADSTGLTQSQLRYWEQKGYISSVAGPNQNRKYTYPTLLKVTIIKTYLDEGFTLAAAAKKAMTHKQTVSTLKHFVMDRFEGITSIDDTPALKLGEVEGHENETLYALVSPEGTVLRLMPKDD